MGRILRAGNFIFNRTTDRTSAKIVKGITSGTARAGRYVGPLINFVGVGVSFWSTAGLLGIPVGFLLYGFGKLEQRTKETVEAVEKGSAGIRSCIAQAEAAKADGDYNTLFGAARELKKAGDALGEKSYLEMYRMYCEEIEAAYESSTRIHLGNVDRKELELKLRDHERKNFREYLVAFGLDLFNDSMNKREFLSAYEVAEDIIRFFEHFSGEEARNKALNEIYKEHFKKGEFVDAERIADKLIKIGVPDSSKKKTIAVKARLTMTRKLSKFYEKCMQKADYEKAIRVANLLLRLKDRTAVKKKKDAVQRWTESEKKGEKKKQLAQSQARPS